MWKCCHTAFITLAFACSASGQFTDIWTTTNMFAVNEMASQCYSASVERCNAVGVTPDSPSWYDYFLGKNHAKLASVKANIAAVRPYFVNPRTNALELLQGRNTAAWTNDIHFLTDCALPTNAISETPWFKSQYRDTTGGWVHCWLMLTNMVKSEMPASSWGVGFLWYGQSFIITNSWDALVDSAVSSWVYYGAYTNEKPYSTWYGVSEAGSPGDALVGFLYANPVCSFLTNSPERKTVSYYIGGAFPDDPYYAYDTNFFDAQGTSVSTNWFLVGSVVTNAQTYDVVSSNAFPFADGSTDPGIPPNSNADPSALGNENWLEYLGYIISDCVFVHDWVYSTNGFKYR